MAITKKQRQVIWAKSNGKCWYCGCDLPENGWHADHIQPIIRESKIVPDTSDSIYSHKFVATGKCGRVHHDTVDNMVPACAPCNLFKATYDIEFFRQEIEAQIERVRKATSGFRIAERFGLIETKPQPVKFWFETQAQFNAPPVRGRKEKGMKEQWIIHILGPDDIIDQPDELTALREANALNKNIAESHSEHPDDPFCMAIVTNLIT